MGFIGAHGVETLKRYRYSGEDRSVVAKYVLQPFWSRCVTLFPLWMPTWLCFPTFQITLTGFSFLVLSALLGYICSPHLDTAPPRWVHLAHGLLLFLYQFEALALGSTLMCGGWTLCFWVVAAVPFYLATWEQGLGGMEPKNWIHLASTHTHGPTVPRCQDFRKSLPFFGWIPLPFLSEIEIPLYVLVLILMIVCAVIPTVRSNVSNVQEVVEARKGSMALALAMFGFATLLLETILPFIVLLAGVAIWCYLSPSSIMRNQPHLLVIGTGFNFGYLVGRMILAHLCDEPKGLKSGMFMSLVFLCFPIANALIAKINDGSPLVDELVLLLLYCAYTVGLYLHLAVSVVHEIKDALGIYCFRCGNWKPPCALTAQKPPSHVFNLSSAAAATRKDGDQLIMTKSDVGGFSRSCNGTGRGRGRAYREEDTGQSATAVPHPLHEKTMTRARDPGTISSFMADVSTASAVSPLENRRAGPSSAMHCKYQGDELECKWMDSCEKIRPSTHPIRRPENYMVVLHSALSAQHCKHDSSVQSDELDGKLSWKPGFGSRKQFCSKPSRARSVDVDLRGQTYFSTDLMPIFNLLFGVITRGSEITRLDVIDYSVEVLKTSSYWGGVVKIFIDSTMLLFLDRRSSDTNRPATEAWRVLLQKLQTGLVRWMRVGAQPPWMPRSTQTTLFMALADYVCVVTYDSTQRLNRVCSGLLDTIRQMQVCADELKRLSIRNHVPEYLEYVHKNTLVNAMSAVTEHKSRASSYWSATSS
uniref:Putative aminoalcoholphosphotransferase n=1 Tax=Zea mays TaxID=4577 RepID=Q6QP44_MAIZE|nr:putative aminoalcoholphosphotransferase [Zea mays]